MPQAQTAQTAAAPTAAQIRNAILNSAVTVTQPIQSPMIIPSPVAGSPNIFNIVPRSVGLLKKLYLKVRVDFTTPAGCALARAPFGPANVLSNITLTDLNNLQRINTSGLHLALVQSVRRKRPVAAAALTDSPMGFGSNYPGVISCPTAVAAGNTGSVFMFYEVPVMYQDHDFRGAIYLGTTQAQMNVSATFNPLFAVAAGQDATQSVFTYTGNAPTINAVTITPYQVYLDQLPVTKSGPLLPTMDMGTIYQLLGANNTGFVANTPNSIPYSQLRKYLSTILIYDNGGVLNPGTDITSIALQQANTYNFWLKDPAVISYETRCEMGDDMPAGVYFLPSRMRPIDTQVFGNTSLVVTPSLVNANAQFLMLYEFFADALTIAGGGSLPSN